MGYNKHVVAAEKKMQEKMTACRSVHSNGFSGPRKLGRGDFPPTPVVQCPPCIPMRANKMRLGDVSLSFFHAIVKFCLFVGSMGVLRLAGKDQDKTLDVLTAVYSYISNYRYILGQAYSVLHIPIALFIQLNILSDVKQPL